MILHVKIGTMPGSFVHVCRNRRSPIVGETFEIKRPADGTDLRSIKPLPVICREIRYVGGEPSYIHEQW